VGGAAAVAATAATVRTEASAAELTEYLGRGRGTVDVRQLDITTARLDQVRGCACAGVTGGERKLPRLRSCTGGA
jgi:hypothetical protein